MASPNQRRGLHWARRLRPTTALLICSHLLGFRSEAMPKFRWLQLLKTAIGINRSTGQLGPVDEPVAVNHHRAQDPGSAVSHQATAGLGGQPAAGHRQATETASPLPTHHRTWQFVTLEALAQQTQGAVSASARRHGGVGDVLVVDDDPAMRVALPGMLAAIFGPESVDLHLAEHVAAAKARLLAWSGTLPLVVSDNLTGDGTGLELAAWMRQDPQLAGTPIVLITGGFDYDKFVRRAQHAGADATGHKPVDMPTLCALLQRLRESLDGPTQSRRTRAGLPRTAAERDAQVAFDLPAGYQFGIAGKADAKQLERLLTQLTGGEQPAFVQRYLRRIEPAQRESQARTLKIVIRDAAQQAVAFVETPYGDLPHRVGDATSKAVEKRPTLVINNLVVDPKQRGNGLGRALIKLAAALADTHKVGGRRIRDLVLWVDPSREAAIGLYQSLGFVTAESAVEDPEQFMRWTTRPQQRFAQRHAANRIATALWTLGPGETLE